MEGAGITEPLIDKKAFSILKALYDVSEMGEEEFFKLPAFKNRNPQTYIGEINTHATNAYKRPFIVGYAASAVGDDEGGFYNLGPFSYKLTSDGRAYVEGKMEAEKEKENHSPVTITLSGESNANIITVGTSGKYSVSTPNTGKHKDNHPIMNFLKQLIQIFSFFKK